MSTPTIRSASHRLTNERVFKIIVDHVDTQGRILDFGSGPGHMCQRLGNHFEEAGKKPADHIHACEIDPSEFLYDKIKCTQITPDSKIPFPDNHFDCIYAIEVIEHTPRPYDLFQEAFNKLLPGGMLLLTTPNLLHMKSRFEFLFTGFGTMYPPPSSLEKNAGRICGHIMPLNLAYFAYAARKAGFKEPEFHLDRRKRSAIFLSILAWPFLKLASWHYSQKIRDYDLEDWEENQKLIPQMNSFDVLTARSCIIAVVKPKN